MNKYKKIEKVIDAVKFSSNNELKSPLMDDIVNWANQGQSKCKLWHNCTDIYIVNKDGDIRVGVGDYIVKDENGDFHHHASGPFERHYEKVN